MSACADEESGLGQNGPNIVPSTGNGQKRDLAAVYQSWPISLVSHRLEHWRPLAVSALEEEKTA